MVNDPRELKYAMQRDIEKISKTPKIAKSEIIEMIAGYIQIFDSIFVEGFVNSKNNVVLPPNRNANVDPNKLQEIEQTLNTPVKPELASAVQPGYIEINPLINHLNASSDFMTYALSYKDYFATINSKIDVTLYDKNSGDKINMTRNFKTEIT